MFHAFQVPSLLPINPVWTDELGLHLLCLSLHGYCHFRSPPVIGTREPSYCPCLKSRGCTSKLKLSSGGVRKTTNPDSRLSRVICPWKKLEALARFPMCCEGIISHLRRCHIFQVKARGVLVCRHLFPFLSFLVSLVSLVYSTTYQ